MVCSSRNESWCGRMSHTESASAAHPAAAAPARWPRRFCGDAPTRSGRLSWPDLQTQRCWPPLLCSGRNWSQTPGLWTGQQRSPQACKNKVKRKKKEKNPDFSGADMVHVKKKKTEKKLLRWNSIDYGLQNLFNICAVFRWYLLNEVVHLEKCLRCVFLKKTPWKYSHLPRYTLHLEYQRASQSGTLLAQDQHFLNQSMMNRPQQNTLTEGKTLSWLLFFFK